MNEETPNTSISPVNDEVIIAEWSMNRSSPKGSLASPTLKRYRLAVHAPQTRDGRDRVLRYKSAAMARLNAWMARQIGAERVAIVDTMPSPAVRN